MAENYERTQDNIAEELMIGNTRIRICDYYCNNCSNRDIKDILDRIALIAQEHFTAASLQQKKA